MEEPAQPDTVLCSNLVVLTTTRATSSVRLMALRPTRCWPMAPVLLLVQWKRRTGSRGRRCRIVPPIKGWIAVLFPLIDTPSRLDRPTSPCVLMDAELTPLGSLPYTRKRALSGESNNNNSPAAFVNDPKQARHLCQVGVAGILGAVTSSFFRTVVGSIPPNGTSIAIVARSVPPSSTLIPTLPMSRTTTCPSSSAPVASSSRAPP